MNDSSAHRLGHRKRLKERFLANAALLPDYEFLELLLGYAIPRRDIKPLAKNLLKHFATLKGVFDASPEELESVGGIGPSAATLIKLVRESGTRYLKEKAREKVHIACTEDLIRFCRSALEGIKEERFCIVYLDAQNRLIDMDVIAEGIVNQAVVYPRKVLENALRKKASAMILVHNHPSGYPNPSSEDIDLTRTIIAALKSLNIIVHDHLIIGESRIFSFLEAGILPRA